MALLGQEVRSSSAAHRGQPATPDRWVVVPDALQPIDRFEDES